MGLVDRAVEPAVPLLRRAVFWLSIERVIYSNMAELVAEPDPADAPDPLRARGHAGDGVRAGRGRAAAAPRPPDATRSCELIAPMIVTYDTSDKDNDAPPPEEFYTASSGDRVIRQSQDDDSGVTLFAELRQWHALPAPPPRRTAAAAAADSVQGAACRSASAPRSSGPSRCRRPCARTRSSWTSSACATCSPTPSAAAASAATLPSSSCPSSRTSSSNDSRIQLSRGPLSVVEFDAGAERYQLRKRGAASSSIRKGPADAGRARRRPSPCGSLQLDARRAVTLDVEAREAPHSRCMPDRVDRRMHVDIVMIDCVVGDGGERTPRPTFPRQFSVAMPPELAALEHARARDYLTIGSERRSRTGRQQRRLLRDVLKIRNGIVSELNARASFGVSCFILVMVGCALGMMFRSGNFLSAFARQRRPRPAQHRADRHRPAHVREHPLELTPAAVEQPAAHSVC